MARCYGLGKIYKKNYPLRAVISTNNTPTRILEQDFNMILKNSLSRPNYSVKNNCSVVSKQSTAQHCCIRVFFLIFYFLPPITDWHTSGD